MINVGPIKQYLVLDEYNTTQRNLKGENHFSKIPKAVFTYLTSFLYIQDLGNLAGTNKQFRLYVEQDCWKALFQKISAYNPYYKSTYSSPAPSYREIIKSVQQIDLHDFSIYVRDLMGGIDRMLALPLVFININTFEHVQNNPRALSLLKNAPSICKVKSEHPKAVSIWIAIKLNAYIKNVYKENEFYIVPAVCLIVNNTDYTQPLTRFNFLVDIEEQFQFAPHLNNDFYIYRDWFQRLLHGQKCGKYTAPDALYENKGPGEETFDLMYYQIQSNNNPTQLEITKITEEFKNIELQ